MHFFLQQRYIILFWPLSLPLKYFLCASRMEWKLLEEESVFWWKQQLHLHQPDWLEQQLLSVVSFYMVAKVETACCASSFIMHAMIKWREIVQRRYGEQFYGIVKTTKGTCRKSHVVVLAYIIYRFLFGKVRYIKKYCLN